MNLLLIISIVIFAGLIGGRIANKFHLPNVSGFIVAGLIIGPSFLNIIQSGEAAQFGINPTRLAIK